MSYIAPNSTIDIFTTGTVHLSPGNENVYYFSGVTARDNYFNGKVHTSFTNQSYVHKERGYIRIQATPEQLVSANYMRYKNESFENRWIYAFITHVEYVSNVVQDVYFDIDYITTWLPYASFGQCFIERQHNETDEIGDNIVEEGFPAMDYFIEEKSSSGFIGSGGYSYVIATTFDPDNPKKDEATAGAEIGGIYSGLQYKRCTVSELNTIIDTSTTAGCSDGIIGIAVVPSAFLTEEGDEPVVKSQTFDKPYDGFGSYTDVKNNKLFTYPFKSLSVTNMEGAWKEYKIEDFSGTVCGFEFCGVTGLQTQIVCSPVFYKSENHYIADNIVMEDFPLCTWKTDPYQAYLAQNKSSIGLKLLGDVATPVASAFNIANTADAGATALEKAGMTAEATALVSAGVKGAVGALAIGTISNVVKNYSTFKDMSRKPMSLSGSQGVNAILKRNLQTGERKEFYFIFNAIKPEYAKIIDDFFSMYGYAQKKVAVPNLTARPVYTYIKTVGCQAYGAMPADAKRIIEQRFDEGVRLWQVGTNGNVFCNYNTDNSPGITAEED